MQQTREPVKGKIHGSDPQRLQDIADRIQNEFNPDCVASRPLPSREGGYHLLLTFYKPRGGI